jgi:hypothetical protein
MRPLLIGLMLVVGLAPLPGHAQAPSGPASPRVSVTFEPNGLVSLAASEVSLREILAEWTRKGGTQFKGAETVPGSALTVQYEHRPEIEVMNSLLRNAAGVVIAPRDLVSSTGASNIGIVFVLATSNPTSSGGYSAPVYSAPASQYSTQGSPDSEIPPIAPGRSGEPPQPAAPPPSSRPAGSPVAVQVVPVAPVPTAGAPTPTPTPAPTGPGRGGDGRGGSGRGSR